MDKSIGHGSQKVVPRKKVITSAPESPNTVNYNKGLGVKTPIQSFLESKKFNSKIKNRRKFKKKHAVPRRFGSAGNTSLNKIPRRGKLIKKKNRKKAMSFANNVDSPNQASQDSSQPSSARISKRYNSLTRAVSQYEKQQSNINLIQELPEELINTGRDQTSHPPMNKAPQPHPRAQEETSGTHPSNYKKYPQLLEDDAPPQQKLVEQRNIDYSYDGYNMSFIERIINLDFIDDSPGYRTYIKDCKVQIKVARDLRRTLRAMPFRGAVDVPFTHECKPQFVNKTAKKLLLLDLDETLIHSEMLEPGAPGNPDHDFILDIPLNDGTMDIEVKNPLNSLDIRSDYPAIRSRIHRKDVKGLRTGHIHGLNKAILRPSCQRIRQEKHHRPPPIQVPLHRSQR